MDLFIQNHPRGQVGIGTLIVFIAMVLVAATAGGVLVNTAGNLQTQAEETGSQSTMQVASNLDVQNQVGLVNESGNESTVEEVVVGVQPAAGSSELDLEGVSIQHVGDTAFSNLVHIKSVPGDSEGVSTVFNTEPVSAVDGGNNVMTDSGDRYDIVMPLRDERPFVQTATFENVENDANETLKIDIAFNNATTGGLDDLSDVAGAVDGVDEDDFAEVNGTQESFDEAVLFENNEGDADFTTESDESALDDATEDEDIVRVVAYGEAVDPTQLAGFDDDLGELDDEGELASRGALAPVFFGELSNTDINELVPDEDVELTLTTEAGSQTTTILQVPPTLAGDEDGTAVGI